MARTQSINRSGGTNIGSLSKIATSPDIGCHQGIATDGVYFYGIDSNAIYKFDTNWNAISSNTRASTDAGVTHLGDGQYYNGRLYIAAENFVNDVTSATNKRIAVYNASDLSFVTSYAITEMDEISSVCVDGAAGLIYAVSYNTGNKIFKYSLSNGAYLGSIPLSYGLKRIQSITMYDNYFWLARGTHNRLYKVSMTGRIMDMRPLYLTVGGGELEGVDFTTGTLYVVHDTGPKVVETYHLSPSNQPPTREIPSSLNFNASSTVIPLAQVAGLPLYNASGYSICGLIRPRLKGSSSIVYGEGNSSTNAPFLLLDVLAPNVMRIRINNDSGTTLINVSSDIVIPRNKWVPFVWSDSNGTCFLMVDGKIGGSSFNYTPSGTLTLNRSALGALPQTTNTSFFAGAMSSIRLFNYALTYEQALNLFSDNTCGNVRNYELAEGTGAIANDTSVNNSNAMITNGNWSVSVPAKKRDLASNRVVV